MRMPFGKYKGEELQNIPTDYICWLSSIELKENLKTQIDKIINSDTFKKKINFEAKIIEHLQETEKAQTVDYASDLDFWIKANPYKVYELERKNSNLLSKEQSNKLASLMYYLEKK